jgi:protein involved in polysaccharide export with SLBB domain
LAAMEAEKKVVDAIGVPFNVYDIGDVKAGKQEANPYIRPGDIIIVQEAFPIFITGSVVQPSNLYLRNNMSLHRAIAQVGGVTKNAKTDKVRIYRQKKGQLEPEMLTVNFEQIRKNKAPDVLLQPYDIIEVGEQSQFSIKNLPTTLLGFAMSGANTAVSNTTVRIIN